MQQLQLDFDNCGIALPVLAIIALSITINAIYGRFSI
jgi:hypothetical protein